MTTESVVSIPSEVARNVVRFLTFRRPSGHLREYSATYLGVGLVFTWLAGIGRYWDNPKAELWQHLGLGSLAYVLILALVIYVLVLPLKPNNWSYRNVLLFVSLTAPPALLYAIPVELFLPLEKAAIANAWFLAIVAAWRVALYGWFLRTFCRLDKLATAAALLLPLVLIVVALTVLNLEHVVFRLMSGIRDEERTANDLAYQVVLQLTFWSTILSPLVLVEYAWCIYRIRKDGPGLANDHALRRTSRIPVENSSE